jgi:peroxiredoxin
VLIQVSEEYAQRGVEFVAINQMEHAAKVKSFLREHSMHVTAGLDPDGEVSRLYHVGGIPQTLIIGRDGIVHFVHIGNSDELREQVTTELNSLVVN